MLEKLFRLLVAIACCFYFNLSFALNETVAPLNTTHSNDQLILVLDAKNLAKIPDNFRTTSAPIPSNGLVDTTGLKELRAMYDMLHNAKKVKFENIIKRQSMLGGIDLLQTPLAGSYNYGSDVGRINLLKQFYQYAAENKDNYQTKWLELSKQNNS